MAIQGAWVRKRWAAFSMLRVGGDPKPAYDVWPYPAVKVYDPYGDLERAGKPGPFYR